MTQTEALKLAMDWYGSGNQDPDEFEKLILSIVAQPEQEPVACAVCNEVHTILDGDESQIIRNAADGYPEGRTSRVLTLQERVTALCVYAADWKRWCIEKETTPPQRTQPEPVAYDKTELNCFAQDLYDQKMREGKRGHYESMFHVIHQCIKKVAPPPQRKPLTDEQFYEIARASGFDAELMKSNKTKGMPSIAEIFGRAIEAKLREKNT